MLDEDLTTRLLELDWPQSPDAYLYKQLFVLRSGDAVTGRLAGTPRRATLTPRRQNVTLLEFRHRQRQNVSPSARPAGLASWLAAGAPERPTQECRGLERQGRGRPGTGPTEETADDRRWIVDDRMLAAGPGGG